MLILQYLSLQYDRFVNLSACITCSHVLTFSIPRRLSFPANVEVMDPTDDEHGRLSSRIDSFRDISSLGYRYYDAEVISAPASSNIDGRESIVSLPTQFIGDNPEVEHSTSGRWRGLVLGNPGDSHQTLVRADTDTSPNCLEKPISTRNGHGGRFSGSINDAPMGAVPDVESWDGVDISLLSAAAPIDGATAPHIESVPSRGGEDKAWRQEQELAGHLTGGLGAGFKAPAIQIRGADLPSPTSPVIQRMPVRALSFSRRKGSVNITKTRKLLGQDQANMTGRAVQVITEEPEADDNIEPTTPL